MDGADTLLATLAQSSAAIVAIVGGFLVSRLVALSSERQGLRRMLREAQERLALLDDDYQSAYEYRLQNSKNKFYDFVIDDLISAEGQKLDLDGLTEENIPRGSTFEEMRSYADELDERVVLAFKGVADTLRPGDDRLVSLEDLRARGLSIAERDEDLYELVIAHVAKKMPRKRGAFGLIDIPSFGPLTPGWRHEIDARRLDESIRDELELIGQITASRKEASRLHDELRALGKPVGVLSAIWVLGLLSVLGIVFPVVVLALQPMTLTLLMKSLLVGSFVVGLLGVLSYILWYQHQLSSNDQLS
jgi:hypothetical protein